MNIITYITAHWSDIITALTSIIIGARVIVKLTPTPKDDTILDSIVEGLKHLGLVVKDKSQIILAVLCMLSLTSCAGLLAYAASPLGQASIATAEALGKQLAKATEQRVLEQIIIKASASIDALNAQGVNPDVAKEIVRQSEIAGLTAVITTAQQQYIGLTGKSFTLPKNPLPSVTP